jgi:glycerol-3-phosphate dehydrogenase
MGRCQGGFCAPRVMEILAREQHLNTTELTKGGGESQLITGSTKEGWDK